MGKVIDNYVLERTIGRGQFGEVYKGYNKNDNTDVAIKAINRAKLKGKYYELLENEIKVLRSCENPNIIRLYDIKKTSNNIYLMLEYCNEGDLMQYLRQKRRLVEEEAVEIFVQIVNAFRTLVPNKIMHRDFKLANILKHNGVVKIADFGFAKILGEDAMTATMLGSPLNMAPEILGGKDYNNKADIWSIGTCFYEMIFGAPPYSASSIMELYKKIARTPFELPPDARLSPTVEDALRRMLVFNPEERIDWEELFGHPVNRMQEERIMRELEATARNGDIGNVSRFYVANNKVIDNVGDIERKADINSYTLALTRETRPGDFRGDYVNRATPRAESEPLPAQAPPTAELGDAAALPTAETERERAIRIFKHNSARILHERNKYVFLASVAEDAINFGLRGADLLVFLLIKRLFRVICEMRYNIETAHNWLALERWAEYVLSRDFKKIGNYILKEYDLFKAYYETLEENLRRKVAGQRQRGALAEKALKCASAEEVNATLRRLLREYVEGALGGPNGDAARNRRDLLVHFEQLLDCLDAERVFFFESAARQFNFKLFYEELRALSVGELWERIHPKLATLLSFNAM